MNNNHTKGGVSNKTLDEFFSEGVNQLPIERPKPDAQQKLSTS